MRPLASTLVSLTFLAACAGFPRVSSQAPAGDPAAPDATAGASTSTSNEAASVAAAADLSPTALYARGNAEYDARQFGTCAETFDQGLSLGGDERRREAFAYASACCHSLAGNADAAFARLNTAAEAGFRDLAHLQKDPDLQPLRTDPRWSGAVEKVKAKEAAYLASVNGELKALFDADQADRQGEIDWAQVSARDAERRARVDAIVKAGGAKAADDWFHAAMVFQHGQGTEDIARAHAYAAKALEVEPNHSTAKWLYAASKDRWLMREKKPQLYGTQFTKDETGKWVLYEVDPSITDEERAKYNVPPLVAARARAEQMNARGGPH